MMMDDRREDEKERKQGRRAKERTALTLAALECHVTRYRHSPEAIRRSALRTGSKYMPILGYIDT